MVHVCSGRRDIATADSEGRLVTTTRQLLCREQQQITADVASSVWWSPVSLHQALSAASCCFSVLVLNLVSYCSRSWLTLFNCCIGRSGECRAIHDPFNTNEAMAD